MGTPKPSSSLELNTFTEESVTITLTGVLPLDALETAYFADRTKAYIEFYYSGGETGLAEIFDVEVSIAVISIDPPFVDAPSGRMLRIGNGNDGNGNGNNRTNKSRTYHGILMIIALLTAIGGYVAIYIAHSNGKGHIASGDPYIKKFHTWFGYIILVGIVFQSLIGITKYTLLKTQNRNFAKFHGLMGPMLWIWGCINILLGVWFWSSSSYNLFLQIIISISILIIVLITILFFNILLRNSSSSPISASNVDHNVVSSLSTVEVNQTTEVM